MARMANRRFRENSAWKYRPQLELLEDRTLPATFTVVDPGDSGGPGTFRWAVQEANAHPNTNNQTGQPDVINFNLPGNAPFTIILATPLDPIIEPVIIDGSTQPGFGRSAPPVVEIWLPPLDPASSANLIVNEVTLIFQTTIFVDVIERPIFPDDSKLPPPPPPGQGRIPNPVPLPELDPLPDPTVAITLDPKDPVPLFPPEVSANDVAMGEFGAAEQPSPAFTRSERPARAGGTDTPIFLPGNNEGTGKLMGISFQDYNGDGVQDGDEPRNRGRLVYLDLDEDGKHDEGEPTAVTNSDGEYRFDWLKPDTYTVRQVLWPHQVQTLPAAAEGNVVDLGPGEVLMNVDFGTVKVRRRGIPVHFNSETRLPDETESQPTTLSGYAKPLGAVALAGGFVLTQQPREDRKRPTAN